ncbi:hypothetical protein [Sphingomonas sp.]|uniref:hypothetical protein n=1 Tax=Sphingomonas sp. TaxID=28214 RepID=UPI00260470E7|nr:hypothetical protein [Sphingomonas sp.]MDF2493275.1 hypothetical protein [Sphingomonas sp.]
MTARLRHDPPSRPAPRTMRVTSVLIQPEAFGCRFDVIAPRASDCAEFDTIGEARAHADAIAAAQGLLVEERS